MAVLFVAGVATVYASEAGQSPAVSSVAAGPVTGLERADGNMEGKEVRFGIAQSALFATSDCLVGRRGQLDA